MDFCPYCMMPATGNQCNHCGKATAYTAGVYQLPAGTILQAAGGWHTYQIGAVLGQGGFGITYIARLLETGQRVAIKEYYPNHCAQRTGGRTIGPLPGKEMSFQKGMAGFLREAKLLAGLKPLPSVVKALDYFQYNGTAYLAMEFLDGVSLSEKVKQRGTIPAKQLIPRFKPLLKDMESMHRDGIIHRDVAPDNIMWMPDGTLKLMDFGCARSTEAQALTVMLKPRFAPVEQYSNISQGPWTDVYGVAATIYYCITGRVPDDAIERLENPSAMPTPTQLHVDISPQQEKAIMWGLTVQPKHRPQSMDEFMDELYASAVPNTLQTWKIKVASILYSKITILLLGILAGVLLMFLFFELMPVK